MAKLVRTENERKRFFAILALVTDACGVSANENEVMHVIQQLAAPYAQHITTCGQGSIIVSAKNNSPENKQVLMIDAHMDEVGLMVAKINANGYLQVIPMGGLWNHVLLAQKYFILTRDGKKIPAIVGSIPVHIVSPKQRLSVVKTKQLYLDIGVENAKEVAKNGIMIGDIAFKATKTFRMTNPAFACGKALDNRFSCATLLLLLQQLAQIKLPLNVKCVFSCQEEVGLRGVKTATYKVNPDIAIVVDTTVSNDQHEAIEKNGCVLGGGPIMSIADAYVNSDATFLKLFQQLASKKLIPYAYNASLGGGTNGGYVYRTRKGVATIVLSLATRYLHSHTEVCHLDDGINTASLIYEFIRTFRKQQFWETISKVTPLHENKSAS